MRLSSTPIWKNPSSKFLRRARMRAAASSACLAAWRAAQGAAPRMPSRRLPEASAGSAFAARPRFLLPVLPAGGGIDLRACGATDLRAGGATDLRAGGATDLRAGGMASRAAGATDLRTIAEGRMDFGARSAARASVFARDFIERVPNSWCIRMIADAP